MSVAGPPYSIPAGSDATYSIDVGYTVRPFGFVIMRMGQSMTFTALPRLGLPDDLPQQGNTACGYTWELRDITGALIDSRAGTATLGAVLPYVANEAHPFSGPVHLTLTVTVLQSELSIRCGTLNVWKSTLDFTGDVQPQPGPCGSITPQSAYVGFFGSVSGCTPSRPNCLVTDDITFVTYPVRPWAFSCSPFTYVWVFADGETSTAAQPTHRYTKNGAYQLLVGIKDGSGTQAIIASTPKINVTGEIPIIPTDTSGRHRRPSVPPHE